MDETCNPIQKKGERSVFCSHYKGCLDHAVRMSWLYWDCGDCRYKHDQGARPEVNLFGVNPIGCYDLKVNRRASAVVFGTGS